MDTNQILAELHEKRHDLDEVMQIYEKFKPHDMEITEESIYKLGIKNLYSPTDKADLLVIYQDENEDVTETFCYSAKDQNILEVAKNELNYIEGLKKSKQGSASA